jgi:hypothetical protein
MAIHITKATINDIKAIINYMWDEEKRHFEENWKDEEHDRNYEHIFEILQRVDLALTDTDALSKQ